jgi:hypothetical protein
MNALMTSFYKTVPPHCGTCGYAYTISPVSVGDEFVVKPRCQTGCPGMEKYELRIKKEAK